MRLRRGGRCCALCARCNGRRTRCFSSSAILAHKLDDWDILLLAFAAFSLCASGVYVLNDLCDIESDRRHPRKRTRPFASGSLPIRRGVVLAILLPLMAAGTASFVSWSFAGWLGGYFLLTCAYSMWLKRKVVVDVIALASLYTLRLLAGADVAEVEVSAWLLAFGMFFFLSLAFAKRFTELLPLDRSPEKWLPGRGYLGADVDIIRVLGPVSGYLAVLVLALYIDSDKVRSSTSSRCACGSNVRPCCIGSRACGFSRSAARSMTILWSSRSPIPRVGSSPPGWAASRSGPRRDDDTTRQNSV